MRTASNAQHDHRHHHLWPQRSTGRLAVASGGLALAAFVFFQAMVIRGERGGDRIFDNLWLAGPAMVVALGALGAVVAGVVALVRDHERAALVVLAFGLGATVVLFVVGEFMFPH